MNLEATRMKCTLAIEEKHNAIICSLHPHKALLKDLRVRSYCIRRGWGNIMAMFQRCNTQSAPINKED